MPKYLVTIIKTGSEVIEAESAEQAEQIAREIEADGAFFMSLDVDVTVSEEY